MEPGNWHIGYVWNLCIFSLGFLHGTEVFSNREVIVSPCWPWLVEPGNFGYSEWVLIGLNFFTFQIFFPAASLSSLLITPFPSPSSSASSSSSYQRRWLRSQTTSLENGIFPRRWALRFPLAEEGTGVGSVMRRARPHSPVVKGKREPELLEEPQGSLSLEVRSFLERIPNKQKQQQKKPTWFGRHWKYLGSCAVNELNRFSVHLKWVIRSPF